MANWPPKVTQASLGIRRYAGTTAGSPYVNLCSTFGARVTSIEQNAGDRPDVLTAIFPTKRIGYFGHTDPDWKVAHFDEVRSSVFGDTEIIGRVTNWVRQWDGNDEQVEVKVLGNNDGNEMICHGIVSGKWSVGDATIPSVTKDTVLSAELIFNRGGFPDYNLCQTQYSNKSAAFWIGGKYQTTAGWWNPITAIQYLTKHVWGASTITYSAIRSAIGSVASTGGWSGTASGADLTFKKPFPEYNVDGLTHDEAIAKILDMHGGYKSYCTVGNDELLTINFFRTFPPYTAQQNKVTVYLQSTGSTKPASTNNVQRGRLNKDGSARATHIVGFGGRRRYLVGLELVRGWNDSLTSPALADPYLTIKNSATYDPKYSDVFRRWIWPADFQDGINSANIVSYRPHSACSEIRMTYTAGDSSSVISNTRLRPLVWTDAMIVDGEFKGWNVTTKMLDDSLGVYLDGDGNDLASAGVYDNDPDSGIATVHSVHLTCVVIADGRLCASAVDPRVATGSVPDIKRVIDYGEQYKYEVSVNSYPWVLEVPNVGLKSLGSTGVVGKPASINDLAGLQTRVNEELGYMNTVQDSGELMIPWIENAYKIGDVVKSIYDRSITVDSVIVGRTWDFENQTTTLQLSDDRYKSPPAKHPLRDRPVKKTNQPLGTVGWTVEYE